MITIAPRENRQETLPDQVGSLILSNETIACVDLKIEIDQGILKVSLQGIYLGKTQETPFEGAQKTWHLG